MKLRAYFFWYRGTTTKWQRWCDLPSNVHPDELLSGFWVNQTTLSDWVVEYARVRGPESVWISPAMLTMVTQEHE